MLFDPHFNYDLSNGPSFTTSAKFKKLSQAVCLNSVYSGQKFNLNIIYIVKWWGQILENLTIRYKFQVSGRGPKRNGRDETTASGNTQCRGEQSNKTAGNRNLSNKN